MTGRRVGHSLTPLRLEDLADAARRHVSTCVPILTQVNEGSEVRLMTRGGQHEEDSEVRLMTRGGQSTRVLKCV